MFGKRHQSLQFARAVIAVFWITMGTLAFAFWLAAADVSGAPLLQAEPTPDPCAPASLTPAGNIVNVRSGPSSNFAQVGQVAAGEERPILARHWQFAWWLIGMEDGAQGWVWDGAVNTIGNLAVVPVINEVIGDGEGLEPAWAPVMGEACLAPADSGSQEFISAPTTQSGDAVQELNANDDGWSQPLNLSSSGLASAPQMVVDSAGLTHVLWQEQGVDGLLYTQQVDDAWLQPVVVETPFGTRRNVPNLQAESPTPLFTPTLLADHSGNIHAFWRDGAGVLLYSRVAGAEFETFQSWSTPRELAGSAFSVAAAVDDGEGIHLAYVHAVETAAAPAGIYYRNSDDGGATWTDPATLYPSNYMRTVAEDSVGVQIAASGSEETGRVYVAWDNASLEKVFLARSVDGGLTWAEPELLDERQPGDPGDAPGPSRPILMARAMEVTVLWQAGHSTSTCRQYYRFSNDGGESWTAGGALLEDMATCPSAVRLLAHSSELTLLLARVAEQDYLLAWNGAEWSEPQAQELLSRFTNPVTYRVVSLDCIQSAVNAEQQLILVGCDAQGNDIWSTTRTVANAGDWFEATTQWQFLGVVNGATLDSCPGAPDLAPAGNDVFHAFWLQQTANGQVAIHYSGWDGTRWIASSPVFSSQQSDIVSLTAALVGENQIIVFWTEAEGQVYLSQAAVGEGRLTFATANSWSTPQRLAIPHEAVDLSAAVVDDEGNVYLAYAVPVNDERGLYLTISSDNGRSWNEPVMIFDGQAADWDIVGQPRLTLSNGGTLHVLWSRARVEPEINLKQVALYSSQLRQDSLVFDDPQLVMEAAPGWYDVASDQMGILHQFWQEQTVGGTLTWHRQSADDGLTWSIATILTEAPGTAIKAADKGTDLHLLVLDEASAGVQQWTWAGDNVSRMNGANVPALVAGCEAAAAVSDTGQLILLYAAVEQTLEGMTEGYTLSAALLPLESAEVTERTSILPAILGAVRPATPEPQTEIPSTDAAEQDLEMPTPMPVNFPETVSGTDFDDEEPRGYGSLLLASLLPVGFVLILVIFLVRRTVLKRKP